MGKLKEIIIDKQNQYDQALAEFLGLEPDELESLEYSIESNESNDGIVYSRIIEFSANNPEDLLSKVKGLDNFRRVEYCDWELEGDDFYEDFSEVDLRPLSLYEDKIEKIKRIIYSKNNDAGLLGLVFQQCYVSIIGCVEAYLYEVCIQEFESDAESYGRFVHGHPDLKDKKIKFCEIIDEYNRIEKTIKKLIASTNFHNLPAVKLLYEKSFEMTFPDFSSLLPFIKLRHDIVHRGGKGVDGVEKAIGINILESLIKEANEFVANVESSFSCPF